MVYRQTFSAANYSPVFQYNYHTGGNISAFSDGTYSSTYSYDNLGQLIRENNPAANKTWVWTYDNAGNITSRKEYAYTTGTLGTVQSTVNYTYGNSNWKDLLTAYNGQSISYDGIGNPTSMLGWSYTWEHGRQLASMSGSGTTWSFDYNADGMRYRRTNGSTTYTYYYNGDMLRYLDINGTKLYFVLDADGKPIEVSYKPANSSTTSFYFYVHNLMGDVMAILDTSGNAVVKYTYDAWGNIISTTGSMASTLGQQNPFRYRSYVYDQETGLYYLQSRYYNPTIGRFINADALVTTGQGILGNNMFAYCRNNPVNRIDPTGEFDWESLFEGAGLLSIGITAVIVAATVITAGACTPLLVVAGATFVAGGITVANGASEVVESVTGTNVMRDVVYGGNKQAYERQKTTFSMIAEVGTDILAVASTSTTLCFVAGTLVLTEEGKKAIEKIEPGDTVWAWDEETNTTALKEVVETYVNETDELVHVFVGGEEIITTPTHPFYSPVKGWTEAVRLRAGDILVLVNGEYVVVEKIQHEILEAPITVYNFQVEGYHTYYVSWLGILTHNRCGGETVSTKRGRQMHKDWDYGPGVAKEHKIGPGARVDGYDELNHIIYELKPNNPNAIQRGLSQLDRYLKILGETDWAGVLVLYD